MGSYKFILTICIIIFIFIFVLYENENNYFRKNAKRGLYNDRCPPEETLFIKKRVENDWKKDRMMYPSKYIEYLEYDNSALKDYQLCLIWYIQNKSGYLPDYVTNDYNKYTYNPYSVFIENHKYKINRYYNNFGA